MWNCNEIAPLLYFCEFCKLDFCIKCTLKEAHEEGYDKTTQIKDCRQIHRIKKEDDSSNNEQNNSWWEPNGDW